MRLYYFTSLFAYHHFAPNMLEGFDPPSHASSRDSNNICCFKDSLVDFVVSVRELLVVVLCKCDQFEDLIYSNFAHLFYLVFYESASFLL